MKQTTIKQLNASFCEYFVHGQCETSQVGQTVSELAGFFADRDATPISLRFAVKRSAFEKLHTEHQPFFEELKSPVTWLLQPEKPSIPSMSFQVHAVSGLPVQPVYDQANIVGCRFEDRNARYTQLQVLSNAGVRAGEATADVFETMQRRLLLADSHFSHAIRTWLFADNILSWYDKLNKARNRFFQENNVFNHLVPASTGIGVSNPFGAALAAELLAFEPLNGNVCIEKVVSPLQCEALDYKSAFSRAVLVTTRDCRRMYVSGTASITPDGQSKHAGDCAKQIELTMQVVEALIHNGGMNWQDGVQAIAYFKDCRDFGLFDSYCRKAALSLAHIKIEADVCRNDLLFELELSLAAAAE